MKNLVIVTFLTIVCSLLSCCDDETKITDSVSNKTTVTIYETGSGSLSVKNLSKRIEGTSDGVLSIVVIAEDSTGQSITRSNSSVMNAYQGDTIIMQYIPNEPYQRYPYIATYTLWDGSIHKTAMSDSTIYQFAVLKELPFGTHEIKWAASYEEENDTNNIHVFGSGHFNLEVTQ